VRELSLHLLDIAENSIAARAKNITIRVDEDSRKDTLIMLVKDDGVGMSAEVAARVTDAFYTTRTTRKVGLGLPLLKLAAEECNGFLVVESVVGRGTSITVQFTRSHIDRMPLGDLASTYLSLLITNPQVHWHFVYSMDDQEFDFDDQPIKECLDGVSLTEPDILAFLRETIQSGIKDIQTAGSF
jgi:hypothetical protein